MRRTEVVLFDLGGTLFYDNPAAWPRAYKRAEAALWKVLRRAQVRISATTLYGRPTTLLEYYYTLRGTGTAEPGTFRVLRDLLNNQNVTVPDSVVAQALRAMYAVTQRNWKVEADAATTLRALRQQRYRLGAVSNGSDDRNAFEMLERAGLRDAFETVITSAAHGWRKPEASIFQAALDHFPVRAERSAMIGDNFDADILGANALGMRTLWITRRIGVQPATLPASPTATVVTLGEVLAALA